MDNEAPGRSSIGGPPLRRRADSVLWAPAWRWPVRRRPQHILFAVGRQCPVPDRSAARAASGSGRTRAGSPASVDAGPWTPTEHLSTRGRLRVPLLFLSRVSRGAESQPAPSNSAPQRRRGRTRAETPRRRDPQRKLALRPGLIAGTAGSLSEPGDGRGHRRVHLRESSPPGEGRTSPGTFPRRPRSTNASRASRPPFAFYG